jgi:hypothetical protein
MPRSCRCFRHFAKTWCGEEKVSESERRTYIDFGGGEAPMDNHSDRFDVWCHTKISLITWLSSILWLAPKKGTSTGLFSVWSPPAHQKTCHLIGQIFEWSHGLDVEVFWYAAPRLIAQRSKALRCRTVKSRGIQFGQILALMMVHPSLL